MTLALALLLLLPQDTAPRLNGRFEVLSRVRAFERKWMDQRDPHSRAAAFQVLENVSTDCIAAANGDCARSIDVARQVLMGGYRRNAFGNYGVAASQRLCERAQGTTYVRAPLVYGEHHAWIMQLSLRSPSGELVCEHKDDDASWDVRNPVRLLLADSAPGDWDFDVSLWPGDFHIPLTTLRLSIVERRDERLAALTTAIDAATETGPRLEVATARMLRGLLESLARGSTEVHEYPGARLLAEAEAVAAAARKGQRWYGPDRAGEYWLALPVGTTSIRTRVHVPEGLTKESPAPLVLALHGPTFDEDAWFDGYGGGQSAELARQRGWLFAAPHCDGTEDAAWLAALVRALSDVYPLDLSRVALIGHDRGGVVALKAHTPAPSSWRAVATMGAWIDPSSAEQLAARPLFLGAGEHDSLRAAIESLHTSIEAAGAKDATLRLYAHTDRWLCPVDALPDVFAWLDVRLK